MPRTVTVVRPRSTNHACCGLLAFLEATRSSKIILLERIYADGGHSPKSLLPEIFLQKLFRLDGCTAVIGSVSLLRLEAALRKEEESKTFSFVGKGMLQRGLVGLCKHTFFPMVAKC